MNKQEYKALKDIVNKTKKKIGENPYYSSVHCMGKVLIFDQQFYPDQDISEENTTDEQIQGMVWSFQVQNKLGDTMEKFLFDKNEPFSEKTVL